MRAVGYACRGIGRLRCGFLAALLIACLAPARSQAETLAEALATTYLNNPQLQAERAKLRATDELVPQALSGWRPTISASGSVGQATTKQIAPKAPNDVFGTTPRDANLQLSQPLYRGGRTVAGTKQAENTVQAQRYALVSVEQDVLLRALTAYMDVLRDQAVLQLTINNEKVLQRDVAAARDRFAVGEVTKTDVAQSESRLARATSERIRAQGTLVTSQARYKEAVGDFPGTLKLPGFPPLPASEAEVLAAAAGHPDVRTAEYTDRAARDAADAAYGSLLPTVTLNGEVNTSRDENGPNFGRNSAQVTAQVSIPLYQAGDVESQVRQARQTVSQRLQELQQQRRTAAERATTAWEALQTARGQIQSFSSQVRSTQVALEGVREEQSVGARTVLDVLDAEQEALNAQVGLVTAKRDALVAAFQVLSAMGRLTAHDLALQVPYYDVDKHYREVRDKLWGSGPPVPPAP